MKRLWRYWLLLPALFGTRRYTPVAILLVSHYQANIIDGYITPRGRLLFNTRHHYRYGTITSFTSSHWLSILAATWLL